MFPLRRISLAQITQSQARTLYFSFPDLSNPELVFVLNSRTAGAARRQRRIVEAE